MPAQAATRFGLRSLHARRTALDAGTRHRADLRPVYQRTLGDIGVVRADIDAELRRLPRGGL